MAAAPLFSTRRVLVLVAAGAGSALAACNAITGLDTNYREVDCFPSGNCPDGSADAGGDQTTTGDGPMMPDGTTGDGKADAPAPDGPSCSPATAWPMMLSSPIVPPSSMAGLGLRGQSDAGITLPEVVAVACEVLDGGDTPPGMHVADIGDAGQVQFAYDKVSLRYYQLTMNAGYTGALDFQSPDGGAKYHAAIGQKLTKNGAPYDFNWSNAPDGGRTLDEESTELYNAMVSTYAPGTPLQTDCRTANTCFSVGSAGFAYFGVRSPLKFYMYFGDTINNPLVPTQFYAQNPIEEYDDFTNPAYWTSFDTTQIKAGDQGFAGVQYDEVTNHLYLVPSGATTPVVSYNTNSDQFTNASQGWQSFDVTTLTPQPKGFSGSGYDGVEFFWFAGTTGICVQYDNATAFGVSSAWTSFDATQLTPAPSGFAGAVGGPMITPMATGYGALFVPATNGVVAQYSDFTDFTSAANWSSFDLKTISPRLTHFHGAARVKVTYYLVPSGDTLAAAWDSHAGSLNLGWSTFDLAPLNAGVSDFQNATTDGRYVYFAPGAGAATGASAVRYDTTQPFTSASAWQTSLYNSIATTTGMAWDGRYIYFSSANSVVVRYDTQKSFTADATAWTAVDVSHFITANNLAFNGMTGDGRYLYFVPDTFSTVARFDAKFPPYGPPIGMSFSSY